MDLNSCPRIAYFSRMLKVSTQSPYLKAIIIFPLVTQLIGSIMLMSLSEWTTAKKATSDAVLFGFFLTFLASHRASNNSMLTLLNTAAIYVISGIKFSFFIHHSFLLLEYRQPSHRTKYSISD